MPVNDSRAVEIIGRNLHADAVSWEDADSKAPHLACNVPENNVTVVKLNTEHRVWKGFDYFALKFNLLFFCQIKLLDFRSDWMSNGNTCFADCSESY
jgi:hypothetical protein